MKALKFYWHIHHDTLIEPLIEPIKNRIKHIKGNKPKNEIELRLKLLKPVEGELPKEFIDAWQKYGETRQKYGEARQKYEEAKQRCEEARQKCVEERDSPQIFALHEKECPNCSWDKEQKTIFPKSQEA